MTKAEVPARHPAQVTNERLLEAYERGRHGDAARDSASLHPLYVDGPLAGQDFPVAAACASRGVEALACPEGGSPSLAPQDMRVVHYYLRQYGISGHVIWVGTLVPPPQDPDWDDIAEHLLSEGARRAAISVPPPAALASLT